jgi:hypothetical protein
MRCAFLAHWTEHSGRRVTRFSRAHTWERENTVKSVGVVDRGLKDVAK